MSLRTFIDVLFGIISYFDWGAFMDWKILDKILDALRIK